MPDPDAAWNRPPHPGGRWRRFGASLPMRGALLAVGTVWILGCVWSYQEQSAFAASKGFTFPHLLPLVIDGFAVSMAGVAWAASLDARPAIPARLATVVAVGASSASNGVWAYLRAHHDVVTVMLGVAVPVAANLAFEVLLAELRRQVQRRRGLPPPVAVPYPRLIRLVLAPWQTFRAWRTLVLEITAMDHAVARPAAGHHPEPGIPAGAFSAPAAQPASAARPAAAAANAPVPAEPIPVAEPAAATRPAGQVGVSAHARGPVRRLDESAHATRALGPVGEPGRGSAPVTEPLRTRATVAAPAAPTFAAPQPVPASSTAGPSGTGPSGNGLAGDPGHRLAAHRAAEPSSTPPRADTPRSADTARSAATPSPVRAPSPAVARSFADTRRSATTTPSGPAATERRRPAATGPVPATGGAARPVGSREAMPDVSADSGSAEAGGGGRRGATSRAAGRSRGDTAVAAPTEQEQTQDRRPVDPRVLQLAQHLATADDADEVTGEMVGPLLNIDVAPRTGRRLLGQARELLRARAQAEALDDPELSVIGGR